MFINGSQIEGIHTLKTWYDHDCVRVKIDGKYYRMTAKTITAMANEFVFTTEKKKVHTYLEIDWEKSDELQSREGK